MYHALYRYRYRWLWNKFYGFLVVAGIAFSLLALVVGTGVLFFRWGGQVLFYRDPRLFLEAAMPTHAAGEQGEGELAGSFFSLWPGLAGSFALPDKDPRALLRSQLPLLAYVPVKQEVEVNPVKPASEHAGMAPKISGKYLVAIYHTHTGESYTLTDGMARLEGKEGSVVKVGELIRQELESKYGIPTLHIKKIHDRQYNSSYMESEKTVRELLREEPQLKVLLDVHRDAGKPRRDCLVKVKDIEAAPILFVVGSDARAPFPTWRQNEQFARQLAAALDKKYPGLCQGVRIKEGRYNQFLHPRALLVEIGSANNTTGEALAAARLFAGVLGEEVRKLVEAEPAQPGAE
ncbi:stage II sporulation protein P [Desulfofundulus sp. TPOSR]|uniref:stage II sporulation protein P n=1 Tax=Desulfofundulus sp. TPOSR TaxID=2714340 RepID=UPI001409BACD|nr:stage II sporulation protein P [Desulfofundulus sp. TPOSR]NHM27305.1 stage II sporulation protein P [Desulfofundulus sp. TPOSR]